MFEIMLEISWKERCMFACVQAYEENYVKQLALYV